MKQEHIPVLLHEVLSTLKPQQDDRYLDLTAGYGGHASEILALIGSGAQTTLVDRDKNSVRYLGQRFAGDGGVTIVHGDYLSVSKQYLESGQTYNIILADIGVSSPHLDNPDRGFSFMSDGALDMRMDQSATYNAADIVNNASKEELADILYVYGELGFSRKLADTIIRQRPYATTKQLAAVIPGTYKTRMKTLAQVFQALRIAVNDELAQLEQSLPIWHKLLAPGGRLGVITFHSLEDRIVKRYFQENAADTYENELILLTKKPVVPSREEVAFNPRARSAKLRVVQRK